MKVTTETGVTNNLEAPVEKKKVEKKSGKRIGFNYIIIKSLKESQKNDVVKCLYIKSLTNFGFCVIKEGSRGDTKDKEGRDIRDRLVWQKQLHEALQDKVPMPKLLGSFEENGNYYLVMEHIKGKPLYKACQEKKKELRGALLEGRKLGMLFIDYLIQIITILESLHQQHVVHRDVTANNFIITPTGRVAVIDMELSYSLLQGFPSPPFQLGTYGYMSPEQEATEIPTVMEDVFSIGAIILQVWTGISPNKITNAPVAELASKVFFFIPDRKIAETVVQCLQPEAGNRPLLKTVRQALAQYKADLKNKVSRPKSQVVLYTQEQIIETVQQAIGTIASPLLADSEKGWFSENMHNRSKPDKNKINKAWYASFNRGAIGVIYMLAQAKTAGLDTSVTLPLIQKGLDLIQEKYINRLGDTSPGLHFGSDGIAACLAVATHSDLLTPQFEYFAWIDKLLEKQHPSLNIMYGIAGQGIANLICKSVTDSSKMDNRIHLYVQCLLEKQEKDGAWIQSRTAGKKRMTRGFANGTGGIIYFLLEYAAYYQDKDAFSAAQRGLHWLERKAVWRKGSIQWLSSEGKEIPSWWCEGAAGNALTFLKAYQLTGEQMYKRYAVGALFGHQTYMMDNNLSQCHGLSGLGEIYLEAYDILKDTEWMERASWIAQVIMQLKKTHDKYGPFWLVEGERHPVANFMIGNSGVLHFLLRYCCPSKIGFPLMPPKHCRHIS